MTIPDVPVKYLSVLPFDRGLLQPHIRVGCDENHIELRDGKVFYHKYDITEDFIDLIRSGYLDKFIPPLKVNAAKDILQ